MKPNTTEYKRAFSEEHYARISVTIPKGQESAVKAHSKARGKSVNGLINDLLRENMGLSEAEWRQRPEEGGPGE